VKACQLLTRLFILSVVIFSFLPADLYGNTAVSIEQAEKMLREGNQRFASGKMKYPNLDDSRLRQVSSGQNPYATVITCSDSRVPVEHIFDAGLGDIFVIRVAGNVCDVDEIGSIEYGIGHLYTPVLVVLGHTS
jgi:carbonic anhydrase